MVVLVALICGWLLLRQYLPGYAKEKGQNLATKEDVAEITEKVESVKSGYAESLEALKASLQVDASIRSAFQLRCLEAIDEVNNLLVEITLHCWRELANRSPNEHYIWDAVDSSDDSKGFHYFCVAIDKAVLTHGLYLSRNAKSELSKLSQQIGLLSSMELALSDSDPDPAIVDSAMSAYETGLNAVKECQASILSELGLVNEI